MIKLLLSHKLKISTKQIIDNKKRFFESIVLAAR
nr:MAG TPA: hypothetical protein [Herelleviridae sp.]